MAESLTRPFAEVLEHPHYARRWQRVAWEQEEWLVAKSGGRDLAGPGLAV